MREILGMLPLLPDMRRLAPSKWWTPRACSLVGFRVSFPSPLLVEDGPLPRVQSSERQVTSGGLSGERASSPHSELLVAMTLEEPPLLLLIILGRQVDST